MMQFPVRYLRLPKGVHVKAVLCLIWLVALTSHGPASSPVFGQANPQSKAEVKVDFNRDVLPILADRCFACHGPDKHSRKAKLRLDVRAVAVKSDAIEPGKPDASELIYRIFTEDADELMPPVKFHKPLTAKQKKTLQTWIAQGAKYAKHWSFVQPVRPALPEVSQASDAAWVKNPIDRFILDRLNQEKLAPSQQASRETLIRRVTLDLTGLPPTPEQVDAYLSDKRAGAYERVVDRLMKTTAYAERRAQDWLDLARYADTRGFADDKMRPIWPYRYWVVRALKINMPFDQFTIEQLAGDMLPNATDEQRLASAFHRNAPQAKGMTYPVEEYRVKGVIDRVNTTGRVWLGLTMGCAECHDHKFDPVTQRDYYAMYALFNNVEHGGSGFGQGGPKMNYKLPSQKLDGQLLAERKRLEVELAAARKESPQFHARPRPMDKKHVIGAWDGPAVVADASKFSLTKHLTITAKINTKQPVADIVSKYDWRGKQRGYVFGIGGEGDANSIPGHLFFWVSSRADSFNGVTVYSSQPVNDGRDHQVAVEFVASKTVRLFIDGIEDKAARFKGKVPASIAKSNRSLAIGSGYNSSPKANAFKFKDGLSEVRLSDQALGDAISIGATNDKVSGLLAAIRELDRAQSPDNVIASVPVMRELSKPRDTFVHIRGNFLKHGDKVSPGVPTFLKSKEKQQPTNRLTFARWLVSGKNPLVARVVANRFWQRYFGYGLARTSDDFGVQGAVPSHPKLLDWLASEFVSSGWDMKHMHQLIVTSATYRQSTRITPELRKRDLQNRWLARMPRVRLPAEQIRDQALAVSGLLVHKAGGPSVFPKHPKNYWQQRILPGKWRDSGGGDQYRKTLYTYWRRMALHPSLELLNAPARELCVARRDVSNVPTQALVLLNDPIFTEAAAALAARVIRDIAVSKNKTGKNKTNTASDPARLERGFRLVLGRLPDADEQAKFLAFIVRERKELKKDQAVWTLVCSVLLNLDEAITRP
jgi:hypothetical protein